MHRLGSAWELLSEPPSRLCRVISLPPAARYKSTTKWISLGAWLALALVFIAGLGVCARQGVVATESHSQVVKAQAAVVHAAKVVDAAENDLAIAEYAKDAADSNVADASAALNTAQAAVGAAFDAAVAEAAAAGRIPRNPYSGLGIPTPDLLAMLNSPTVSAAGESYNESVRQRSSAADRVASMSNGLDVAKAVKTADEGDLRAVRATETAAIGELVKWIVIAAAIDVIFLILALNFHIARLRAATTSP